MNAPTLADLLPGGGLVGLLVVIYWCGRLVLDGFRERKAAHLASRTLEGSEQTAAVTDTAAANAVILATLKALSDENARLQGRLRDKDAELADLSSRLDKVTRDLAVLQKERHPK